ncbi:MAG: hypothetical protein FWD61_11345 [Phycisphaerales bacterium]|nr:hypothetical protein [Phycisphaerales bacterium]
MTKREIVRMVLTGQRPPYVPWNFKFTLEAREKLAQHYVGRDLEDALQNHIVTLGDDYGFFEPVDQHRVRDVFGVIWDRSCDKDIGTVEGLLLPEPTLKNYQFPDPFDPRYFANIEPLTTRYPDRFRIFEIGFTLFERAWTLRGMENIFADFIEHSDFSRALFNAIADWNIAQLNRACEYDIDAIGFGDDWGQQHGLLMGKKFWQEFIAPPFKRMCDAAHARGKFVSLHSCGDVDELFDDLVQIGVNCFNPFQPEVMNVDELVPRYRGRMAFLGGLSTQRTLPFGAPQDVRNETCHLLELGKNGGYILSPAHNVEGDVPLENMLAFIEVAQRGGTR